MFIFGHRSSRFAARREWEYRGASFFIQTRNAAALFENGERAAAHEKRKRGLSPFSTLENGEGRRSLFRTLENGERGLSPFHMFHRKARKNKEVM